VRGLHTRSVLFGFAAGALITFLSAVTIVPGGGATQTSLALQDPGSGTQSPPDSTGPTTSGPTAGPAQPGPTPAFGGVTVPRAPAGLACAAGRNGGATDVGVSSDRIKLGATVVETGIGSAFLSEVRNAMEAIKNRVNRAGGICGRRLQIVYKDDGWDPQVGFSFIRNLVEGEKVFALAVVPSSEGLNQASNAHYFETQKVPVVGSDGMVRSQYRDPYIWPVATATVSIMHVIAKNAWDRGARNFAITYESNYRFGIEGAYAFNQAYSRLSGGKDIPGYSNPLTGQAACKQGTRFCGITSGQGQYNSQASTWNSACNSGTKCDFGVLLLEPKTALDWMNSGSWQATANPGAPGSFAKGLGAAQPLFTYDFGVDCGEKCNEMWVWTGYNPPLEEYADDPAVVAFRNDLKAESSRADVYNQFTEGGYLGMQLLVEALRKAGPNLTRANLKLVLDSMNLDTGLSPALSWRPGGHFSNPAAQAFEFQSKGGFSGWRKVSDYLRDPWLGLDIE
jgi:ABC-type branched-subunit amino acid transport system substrate-binding protein